MPSYSNIQNLDSKGVTQSFELNEPKTEAGIKDTYLYYPTGSNPLNLPGPYIAGPHTFYHYLYRGRMMPTRIEFNFMLTEPNGKTLKYKDSTNTDVTVVGQILYDVDTVNCYRKDALDIVDSCRELFFYLPKEPADDYANLNSLMNLPTDSSNGVVFNNPGIHTFNFWARERQMYVYQWDNWKDANNGGEWQGSSSFPTQDYSGTGAFVSTKTNFVDSNNIWYPREDRQYAKDTFAMDNPNYYYYNQCLRTDNSYNTTVGLTSTFLSDNQLRPDPLNPNVGWNYILKTINGLPYYCVHNHDKAFHYWKYNWDAPVIYSAPFTAITP